MSDYDLWYGRSREERDMSTARISASTNVGTSTVVARDLLIDVSRFWEVFCVDVSTTDLAERSFLEVAHKLSIPAWTWKGACLGIANLQRSWLLVLDNADDPSVDWVGSPKFPKPSVTCDPVYYHLNSVRRAPPPQASFALSWLLGMAH